MKKVLFLLIIFMFILWLVNNENINENLDLDNVQTLIALNKQVQANAKAINDLKTKGAIQEVKTSSSTLQPPNQFMTIIDGLQKKINTNTNGVKENLGYINYLKKKIQLLKTMMNKK